MKLPFNIQVWRVVEHPNYPKGGYVKIELGKHWEIILTREFVEDVYNPRRPGGPRRGDSKLFKDKFFIKLVKEFEVLPRWYGFARYDFDRECGIYMPIPFNLVAALWYKLRYLAYKTIKVEWPQRLMRHERAIYRLGQKDGYEKGRFNRDVVRGAMEILHGEGYDVTSKNDPGA